MSWWSKRYGRPLKDPILLSYSLEELAYEYYLSIERDNADFERLEEESDKIEEAKDKDDQDWADQMEAEDLAAQEAEAAVKTPVDPLKDPENIKWMEEEILKDKEQHGEDFGEDISIDFEDK